MVMKLVHSQYEHCVDMNLAKKGWNFQDDGGKMKVLELLGLTRMAGGDKPLHIFLQHGPPESLLQVGKGHKNSFVPDCLMSLGDDVEMFLWLNDDLVMCLYVPAQKVTIQDEEFAYQTSFCSFASMRSTGARGSIKIVWMSLSHSSAC